jgi:uncharacterized repeat protein (TIGR01451 family)
MPVLHTPNRSRFGLWVARLRSRLVVGPLQHSSRVVRLFAAVTAALFVVGAQPAGAALPGPATPVAVPAGGYIIDMGVLPQTLANSVKPYGLLYDLMVNKKIPVQWLIDPAKAKDAPDFVYNNKTYRGGPFVIPAEFAAEAAATVATWRAAGVTIDAMPVAATLPVYATLHSWPKTVLDAGKGSIAAAYYANAGIPITAYAYKEPSALTACDDFYAMPHADPTWATHSNLQTFNNSGGYIWAACHAVSVLENVDSPVDADLNPNLNFLSTTGLVPFGTHADGTPPYTFATAMGSDPVLQFLGSTELAQLNGSEQIYLPKVGGAWRPTTKVLGWDASQADVPATSPGPAMVLGYGRGYGVPTNGMVMYEGGHAHNKGTTGDAAALRAYFNFALLTGLERGIEVTMDVPPSIAASSTVSVSATIANGAPGFTYQWTSSCGGSFAVPSGVSASRTITTSFTAPATASAGCNIRLIVTDGCGRVSFGADTAAIVLPTDVKIVKSSNRPSGVAAGENLTYTLTVTNVGPGIGTAVIATDTLPAGVTLVSSTPSVGTCTSVGQDLTCALGTLAVGAIATVNIVATSPPAGVTSITNTSAVTTTAVDSNLANNTSSLTTPVFHPAMTLDKSTSTPAIASGGTALYSYVLTNTGDAAFTTVVLGDDKCSPVTRGADAPGNNDAVLNVGEVWKYTCSKSSVTVDTTNTATVTGKDPSGVTRTVTDTAFVDIVTPNFTITKTPDPQMVSIGGTAYFQIEVKNTGDVALANIVITDPLSLGCERTVPSLGIGETVSYVCSKTGVNAGFTNTATGTAPNPVGGAALTRSDTAVVTTGTPSLATTKTAPAGPFYPGETYNYTVTVTNQSTDLQTGVTVADTLPGGVTLNGLVTVVKPLGAKDDFTTAGYGGGFGWIASSWTAGGDKGLSASTKEVVWSAGTDKVATLSRTLNLASGTYDSATVSFKCRHQTFNSPDDYLTVKANGSTIFSFVGAGIDAACPTTNALVGPLVLPLGNPVTLQFLFGGDKDIVIDDVLVEGQPPITPAPVTAGNPPSLTSAGGPYDLLPGQSVTFTVPVTVDATLATSITSVPNTAAATSTQQTSPSIGAVETPILNPSFTVTKVASPTTAHAGDPVTYTIVVKNTGNGPLSAVTPIDPKCSPLTLASGDLNTNSKLDTTETWTYTCTTAVSVDTTNTVTVSPVDSAGKAVPPKTAAASVDIILPAIALTVTPDRAVIRPGDPVVFTYQVTNTGDSPLTGLGVADPACSPLGGFKEVSGDGDLIFEPGEVWTYTCSTTLSNTLNGTVTATANDPLNAPVSTTSPDTVTVIRPSAALTKVATTDGITPIVGKIAPGTTVIYVVTLNNTGNDPLTPVMSDPTCSPLTYQSGDALTAGKVDPAETWRFTCSRVATVDVENTASVKATDSLGGVLDLSANALVDVQAPALAMLKTADRSAQYPGQSVVYTYTVYNDGDTAVAASAVVVSDDKCASVAYVAGDVNTNAKVDVGETWTFTCTYSVLLADVNAKGVVVNAATMHGPAGPTAPVPDVNGSVFGPISTTAQVAVVDPHLAIVKSASAPRVAVGGSVTYTYNVTNTSAVKSTENHMTKVVVTDDKCAPVTYVSGDDGDGQLGFVAGASEVWTYRCTTSLSSDTTNIATVKATDGLGAAVPPATATATVDVVTPAMTITKTVDRPFVSSGETVVFTMIVENTGDSAITAVSVADPYCTPVFDSVLTGNADTVLNVGERWKYTCSVVITALITNTATANGTDVLNRPIASLPASAVVGLAPNAVDDRTVTPLDVTVVSTVAGNDVYPTGSVFAATGPLSDPASGVLTFNPDGTFKFDPAPTFSGVVSFPYKVCLAAPNGTVCDIAIETIVVTPNAVDDRDVTGLDVTLVDTVATNDVYPAGSVFTTTGPLSDPASGVLTFNPDGSFTFDPAPTFSGVVSFPYKVCLADPNGTVCDNAVQKIVVAPNAVDDLSTTPWNTPLTTAVVTNDVYPTGSVVTKTGPLSDPAAGSVTFNPDGSFTFTPVTGFAGVVSFPYKVCLPAPNDAVCDTAVQTIVVAPNAVDDLWTTPAGTTLAGVASAKDVYPSGSTFSKTGPFSDPAAGSVTFNPDGTFSFVPAPGFAGVVSFPYKVCLPAPNDATCDAAIETIVVGPSAVGGTVVTPTDTNVGGTVATNAVSAPGSTFAVVAPPDPAAGVLTFNPDGTFTFDPAPTFAGVVSFPYKVCLPAPNNATCVTAIETIVVGPNAVNDSDVIGLDVTLVDTVVANDSDIADAVVGAVGPLSDPAAGVLTFKADGSFTFDPAPTFAGAVSFPYKVCLPAPNGTVCDTAVQTIVVSPNAVDDRVVTPLDVTVDSTVVGNDVYPTGSVFAATGPLSDPAAGVLTFNADGSFTFDPAPTFVGVVSFPYKVCLPAPNGTVCDTAIQTIVVSPNAVDDRDVTGLDVTLTDTVATNDVYPTGSVFAATGPLSDPAAGVLTFNADGSFTFDPAPTFVGVVSFPYKVCLPAPNGTVCDTAVQTIVVSPVANDDADSTPWNTPLVDTVVTNDVYPTGSVFSKTGPLSDPTAGSVTLNPDGSFTFTPTSGFAGVVSFPYKVCLAAPNDAVCDTAVQTIVVAPHAVDDLWVTPQGGTVNGVSATQDSYPTGALFAATGPLSDPTAGTLTFNPDGSFTFVASPTFAGVVSFPYKVCLPAPNGTVCDTAVETIVVGPAAAAGTVITPLDTNAVGTVTTNGVYAPDSTFTVVTMPDPAAGTLTFNPDGSFTFDPAPTFVGVISFPYQVCLPAPNETSCSTAVQTIVVGPKAVDDRDVIALDATLTDTVASNDFYPTDATFTATGPLSDPAAGVLTFHADGSFTFDPAPTFVGVVSFPYEVCLPAPNGSVCEPAVQTIVVSPNAVDDRDVTGADVTLVDTVATNDVYPTGSLFSATGPLSDPAAGVLTFNPDGSFTFDPAPTFVGVVSFPYKVCLPAPNETVCDTAIQTIVVSPNAVDDRDVTGLDVTLVDTVATNDVYPVGSVVTATGPLSNLAAGVLTFNPDGSFTFDPAPTFVGVVSFPYKVCLPTPNDTVCDTAIQTIVVGPNAVDGLKVTDLDVTVTDTVTGNDLYPTGSVFTETGPLSDPAAGVLTFNPDGTFTFDPAPTFVGVVTFPYKVCLAAPDTAVCDTAIQTIVVRPNAVDDTDSTPWNTPLVDTVATNDVYPTGSVLSKTGPLSDPAAGSVVFSADGSFTFTPVAGFAGVVSFPYEVCLPAPNATVCDPAVQTIVVAPNAVDDLWVTPTGGTVNGAAGAQDVYPTNAVFSKTGPLSDPTAGTLTFNPDGTFTFVASPTFAGVVTFPYKVCLPAPNGTVCDTAIETIVVGPSATGATVTTPFDTTLPGTVASNDVYAPGSTFSVVTMPDPAAGVLTFNPDGSFTFDPAPAFTGVVSFPYKVCLPAPNATSCSIAVETIVVGPKAVNDSDVTGLDVTVVDTVGGNDVYPADSVFTTTGSLSTAAAGTLIFNPDGSFTFDPAPTFTGVVSFPYKVCLADPNATVCATAVQTIVVSPNASDDLVATAFDVTVTKTVASNDTYPAGAGFSTAGPLSNDAAGVLTFNADGTFTFDPAPTFTGVVTFPYKVCLPTPNDTVCETAVQTIVVAPNAVDDRDGTGIDVTLTDTVATNDKYPTGSVFTATGPLSDLAAGTLTLNPDGSYTFDPAPTFVGVVSFPYKVCLPTPNDTVCDTAIQTIVVGPNAVDGLKVTDLDVTVTDTVAGNDMYPTDAVFTATGPLSNAAAGTLTFNPDGTYTFDPAPTFTGAVSFPYKVCLAAPNDAVCDTAIQTIVVRPNAADDTDSTPWDTPLVDTVATNDLYPTGSTFATTGPLSNPAAGVLTFNPDGSFTFDPDPAFVGTVTFPYKVCLPAPNDTVCDTAVQTIVVLGRIGDRIWLDLNRDGKQDSGEPGLGGVTVELRTALGVLVGTTTTDATGAYLFDKLVAGDYVVTVVNTVGSFSPSDATTDNLDSDFTAAGTSAVTLSGSTGTSVDAGIIGTAKLSGKTLIDVTGNGAGADVPLAGVKVSALWAGPDGVFGTADDLIVGSATTAADGSYLFENLPAGSYTVQVDPSTVPAGMAESFERDVALNNATPVSLAAGASVTGIDFGYVGQGSLAGTVFVDANVNSSLGGSDTGIGAVPLTVTWSGPDGVFGTADDLTWPTTSAADGTYSVDHLPAGTFKVTVDSTNLTGVLSTTGGDTKPVTLAAEDHRTAIDFGYGSNVPPVPVDDAATVKPGESVRIPLLANDTDPNANLDPTSVTVVNQPAHGTVTIDPVTGEASYTPTAGFTGVDTFTYRVCDKGLVAANSAEAPLCRIATVTITVPNTVPVVTDGGPDTPIVMTVRNGIPAPLVLTDSEGNTVTITEVVGLPAGLFLNPNGTWGGVATKPGTYVLDLKLCDDGTPVLCTTQRVELVVLRTTLPRTGADIQHMLEAAMAMLLLGAVLIIIRRKTVGRNRT